MPAGSKGLFRSEYDDRGLPDAVRAVAVACRPDDPTAMTQAEFDAGRALVAEHAQAPTARRICTRLNMTWRDMLDMLFDPSRDPARTMGRAQGSAADHDLDPRQVADALLLAASRLYARTIRPHEYVRVRRDLLEEARRKYRHGTPVRLPTVGQIEHAAGGWDAALALAGLDERVHVFTAPSPVSYDTAIERFLETQGAMPTRDRLEAFARAQGFPLARQPQGGHPAAMRRVAVAWTNRGRWAPGQPRPGAHPPYDFETPGTAKDGERRRLHRRTKEHCVDGVVAYLQALPGDQKATQKGYGAWRVGTEHPAASALGRHGGWTAILAEARAERRQPPKPRDKSS